LKSAQDQAKAFGSSAEAIVRSFQGIQDAQFDLYKNNSQLRQRLIGQGVDANWVNQLAGADPSKARGMIAQYGKNLERQAIEAGVGRNVAAALRNQFYGEFGQSAADMELALKPVDPAMAADMQRVEELSKNIAEVWGQISLKLQKLSFTALSAGLPILLGSLKVADELFGAIGIGVKWIDDQLGKLGLNLIAVMKWIPFLGPVISVVEGLYKLGGGGKSEGKSDEPSAAPQGPFGKYQPSSFEGANDNNPLLQRTSLTTEELTDETADNTDQVGKLTSQLEKLNAFYDRMENGVSGGGGVRNAAYTTGAGGSGSGSGSGGASSFGSAQFPNLGGAADGGGGGDGTTTTTPPTAGAQPPVQTGAGGGGAQPAQAGGGGAIPSDAALDAKDKAWMGGGSKVSAAGAAAARSIPEAATPSIPAAAASASASAASTAATTTPEGGSIKMSPTGGSFGDVGGLTPESLLRSRSREAWGSFKQSGSVEDRRSEDNTLTDNRNIFQRGASWLAGKVYQRRDMSVDTPSAGGIRGFYGSDIDRGALDRSALNDATTVRADGSVKVDVGDSGGAVAGAGKSKLFMDTPMMRSSAGQLTNYGPSVADTANQYMESRVASR